MNNFVNENGTTLFVSVLAILIATIIIFSFKHCKNFTIRLFTSRRAQQTLRNQTAALHIINENRKTAAKIQEIKFDISQFPTYTHPLLQQFIKHRGIVFFENPIDKEAKDTSRTLTILANKGWIKDIGNGGIELTPNVLDAVREYFGCAKK